MYATETEHYKVPKKNMSFSSRSFCAGSLSFHFEDEFIV